MTPLPFSIQVTQEEVWRFVGVASTVVGLICYALSSSFNRLFGDWNFLKIFLYSAFSSIISLAILFPKVWQHLRIFQYKTHMEFLLLTSTTVYSFFFDEAAKGKPDAYSLISCVAFAMMSLSLTRQMHRLFRDLMYFFMGALIVQLMEIKLFLCFVGIGFSYILIVPGSYLLVIQVQGEPEAVFEVTSLQSSEDQPQVAIDLALLQSMASRACAQIQVITQADSNTDTALDSAPIRGLRYLRFLRVNGPYVDWMTPIPSLSPGFKINEMSITRILLGGDWVRQHHARLLKIFEEYQRSSWNKELDLLELDSSNESLGPMIDKLTMFNMHFKNKNKCNLHSKLLVSDEQLRDDLITTSLANILLPPYQNLVDRFKKVLGKYTSEISSMERLASKTQAELKHLFRGTRAEKKKLLKLE